MAAVKINHQFTRRNRDPMCAESRHKITFIWVLGTNRDDAGVHGHLRINHTFGNIEAAYPNITPQRHHIDEESGYLVGQTPVVNLNLLQPEHQKNRKTQHKSDKET